MAGVLTSFVRRKIPSSQAVTNNLGIALDSFQDSIAFRNFPSAFYHQYRLVPVALLEVWGTTFSELSRQRFRVNMGHCGITAKPHVWTQKDIALLVLMKQRREDSRGHLWHDRIVCNAAHMN